MLMTVTDIINGILRAEAEAREMVQKTDAETAKIDEETVAEIARLNKEAKEKVEDQANKLASGTRTVGASKPIVVDAKKKESAVKYVQGEFWAFVNGGTE